MFLRCAWACRRSLVLGTGSPVSNTVPKIEGFFFVGEVFVGNLPRMTKPKTSVPSIAVTAIRVRLSFFLGDSSWKFIQMFTSGFVQYFSGGGGDIFEKIVLKFFKNGTKIGKRN